MILDCYDPNGEPILTPGAFCGEKGKNCRLAIPTFSREIYSKVVERYPNEIIGELRYCNKIIPIHLVTAEGLRFVFYLSEIGSAMASSDVIDINWFTGADRFIMFGSAGSLDREATRGKYVVPTEAYRAEGVSYHYAPPADYIAVKNAEHVARVLEEKGFPFVKGRVWTTDAPYMETRELVRRRKSEGCIAVEMELAGVQAVCCHYGIELYYFLAPGDVVDQPDYTPEGLHEANHSMDKFFAALAIAKSIE